MATNINYESFNNPELNTQFNTLVGMTFSGVGTLYQFLNNKTFMEDINFLFITPTDYVSSIRAYPFDVRDFFSVIDNDEPLAPSIPLAGIVDSGVSGVYLKKQYGVKTISNFLIPPIFNSFLDNAPYSELQLYLPYYGFIDLNPNEVVGKYLAVHYAIDFYVGMATIYVTIGASQDIPTHRILLTCECKIGVDIPIGASNYNEQTKNLLMTGIGIVGGAIGLASGNLPVAIGGTQMLLNTSVNAITNSQIRVTSGTTGDGRNAIAGGNKVILIRKYPKIIDSQNYITFRGKPLGEKRQLSTLNGYTECEDVHFVPFATTPTLEETQEIESLLKSGVILNI